MSHFALGVSHGVSHPGIATVLHPTWPQFRIVCDGCASSTMHLLGCCRTGVVCICCSARGGLAAIILLLTGLHQLQCTEGLCSLPIPCDRFALTMVHAVGVCTHAMVRDQFAPTVVHAMSLHPSHFSCPIACGAFAPATEHAVVLHPPHCLGPICTHPVACDKFAPPGSIHPIASIPLHCTSAPTL